MVLYCLRIRWSLISTRQPIAQDPYRIAPGPVDACYPNAPYVRHDSRQPPSLATTCSSQNRFRITAHPAGGSYRASCSCRCRLRCSSCAVIPGVSS